MSTEVSTTSVESKVSDKEFNFRQLESKYRTEVERERQARLELEQKLQAMSQQNNIANEEEESSEPYVDNRRLEKKLARFGQSTQSDIQKAMEKAKQDAKEELRQELWLDSNPDFFDVLQNAEKFAQTNPMLADSILKMPDSFERKKLVYANIKAMNLHKPAPVESSIQDKIDANKRSPFYQPSNIGTAPYAPTGDFSDAGKKAAYDKMQQSKSRLRLG